MASTFSDLKIELIGTGEQVGTWGSTTNVNLGTALEEAIVGTATVTFASADETLTLTNTNGTQAARHLRLNLTGTSGGARQLILGSGCQIDKPYIINNGLADTVTVKNTTGTGVAVPAGKSMWVYNNGTNVVEATNYAVSFAAGSLALDTALPATSGGTGLTSPGSNGNVLTSNGTTWTSAALPTLGTMASQNANSVAITGGSITGITDITVEDGGTGRSSLTANNLVVGNGTSAVNFIAPGTNGQVLTSNGTTWAAATPTVDAIGVGQTWQSVSRSIGTTYTNSTGRPIQVAISTSTNQFGSIRFNINGTLVSSISGGDFGNYQTWNFVIPAGNTYSVTTSGSGSSVSRWWELR